MSARAPAAPARAPAAPAANSRSRKSRSSSSCSRGVGRTDNHVVPSVRAQGWWSDQYGVREIRLQGKEGGFQSTNQRIHRSTNTIKTMTRVCGQQEQAARMYKGGDRFNERMNERTNERTNERPNQSTNQPTTRPTDRQTHPPTDELPKRRVDETRTRLRL